MTGGKDMFDAAVDYGFHNHDAVIYDFSTRKPINKSDDGKTYDNRAGKKCEVYAFRDEDEIRRVIDVFDSRIERASKGTPRMIECRNKMLFVIGINIGIRASDLRTLTWDFFFRQDDDGNLTFRDGYNLRPKKTQKSGKYVTLYFNDAVKKIVNWYVGMYPIDDVHGYVFKSRKGDGAMTVNAMWRVIKGAAQEAGIDVSVGTHTLRKTFGRFTYMNAKDKTQALVVLQKIFNHSSPAVTMNYIGLMNDEITESFNGLNLGIDMI